MKSWARATFIVMLGVIPLLSGPYFTLRAQETLSRRLFDGQSLTGWEGDKTVFHVEAGAIYGGSVTGLASSEYLCTTRAYGDFDLSLEARLEGPRDVANGGVLFRSARKPGSSLVAGYQADMGFVPGDVLSSIANGIPVDTTGEHPLWGVLLDEFRDESFRYPGDIRARLLSAPDRTAILAALDQTGWNRVIITAAGPRITVTLNGLLTATFVEEQPVPAAGLICLQAHSGGPSRAAYRNILIRTDQSPRQP